MSPPRAGLPASAGIAAPDGAGAARYPTSVTLPRTPTVRPVRGKLRDGTPVCVRLVRADDSRYADAFFAWLSDETRYMRFMYPVKALTPEILAGVFAQDGLRRVALVVEPLNVPADAPVPAVGIGRYAPTDDPAACEVAVTVADPWHGRGVGRVVLARLIELARRGGYREMMASAFTTNLKMIGLARSFGFAIHSEPGGITLMRKPLV